MSEETPLIQLSALQHYSYCPRQCALSHQVQSFAENLFTLRGRRAHERVDACEATTENGVRVERSLPLYSEIDGLISKANVVEFLPDGTPYPVEYKHGSWDRPRFSVQTRPQRGLYPFSSSSDWRAEQPA